MNEVEHNIAQHRYELKVDGRLAIAEYRETPDAVVFTHTEVPADFQGRGIASQLVRAALDDVRARGRKVVPRCWFVSSFIARHREYRDLLAGG